jgi:2'-5' RNA ligase
LLAVLHCKHLIRIRQAPTPLKEEPMPRLFTGLEIPDGVAERLMTVRGGLTGARWITPDNYHITLRFIGDIDETTARDIYMILGRVSRDPVPVTVEGITVFGGDRPRALVAKVTPTPALLDLQTEHERLIRRIGLPPEPRKYTPHITLARLRDTSPFELANFLSMIGHLPPMRFVAEAFNVFSSRSSTGGGPYVTEALYPFREKAHDERQRVPA